jgi:hypothetical protein
VEPDENYLQRCIFSNEATFCASGRVNRQNCRILGSGNPQAIRGIERGECLVLFAMFGSFGAFLICETNSDSNDLPGYATVVSVTPVGRSPAKYGNPARWCTPHIGLVLSENFLKCIFLGAGLGVMKQVRELRAHPILRCLISFL